MKNLLRWILMVCVSVGLHASGRSEKIVIKLKSKKELVPLYIESFNKSAPTDAEAYLSALQNILVFDFSYNGRTHVISHNDVQGIGEAASGRDWKLLGVKYVIKSWQQDDFLTLSVLSTHNDKICYAENIPLDNDLTRDRKKIHKFAANLHQMLFNEEGIYNSKILYTFQTKNTTEDQYNSVIEEVYQCDFDGGNALQLTHENSHCVSPSPVLARNSSKAIGFFYVSYKLGQPKIYWSKFNTNEPPKRLSYIPGNQFMPAISKQGNKVAFINDAPGNPEVFIQEFKPGQCSVGKPRQVFSCRRAVQSSPTFSPDGRQIAFVSDKDGSPKIYVMDIPGLNASQQDLKPLLISRKNRENTKPSWSPDGTKLAYISKVDGVRQVWVYDFISQKEWQLTEGGGNKENPQWAANSLHLIFNSVGHRSCELYLVNLHQPQAVRLKVRPGLKRFPVWIE